MNIPTFEELHLLQDRLNEFKENPKKIAKTIRIPEIITSVHDVPLDKFPSEKFLQLLADGADINDKLPSGRTSMHLIAMMGCTPVLASLVKVEADMNVQETLNGCTPLMEAIKEGHSEAAKWLVRSGARVDLISGYGFEDPKMASRHGLPSVIEAIDEMS